MLPQFSRKEHGYDMRQVDEYIDELLAEIRGLSRANHELYLLYLNGELAEPPTDDNPDLDKAEIQRLLAQLEERQSWQAQQLQQVAPIERDIEFSSLEEELHRLQQKRTRKIKVPILSILFYMFLAGVILASYWFGGEISAGPPQNVGGFSAMVVLSRSMQHDIPQGSLIVTRRVDPANIRIGDDITFLRNNTTITHRVVYIHPNYDGRGRGFETAGTANAQRDQEVVLAEAVVGRVMFHSYILGQTVLFIRTNILLVSIFAVAAIVIISVLRVFIFRNEKKTRKEKVELWQNNEN